MILSITVPVGSCCPPGLGHRQRIQIHPLESGQLMLLTIPNPTSFPSTNLTVPTFFAVA